VLNLGRMRKLGSLRNQLLRWLIIPLVALAGLNAVSMYNNALKAADQAYDRSLLASTRALAERVSIRNGRVVADVPYVALDSFETDNLGRIYYKVSDMDGKMVSGFDDLPPVPADAPRSEAYPALVRFYVAHYNSQPIRIAALLQPVYDDNMRGIVLIQVGETLDARRGLTHRILLDTLLQQAITILAMAALVWFAVRLVLRPLMQLKEAVKRREPSDLTDVDESLVHREVRPLVAAMNGALRGMHELLSSQRRFIADASHQLRTPLTVLKTQAEMALRQDDPAAMRRIVEAISSTTDSTIHLANRLLALARVEHGTQAAELKETSLTEIARQVGLDLAPPAVQKGIILSLEADEDIRVHGHAVLLREMVSNLVDNAIRYTPPDGSVTLRVREMLLEVEDSGSGIPAAERDAVFTPFYRSSGVLDSNPNGTGLGLAIVREIAGLHRASITLDDAPAGGLLVRVHFTR
jgi:two-component system, OmpR family, sensor histidine kinase TctE